MKIQLLFLQHTIKKNVKHYLWMIITTIIILFVVKVSVGMISYLIMNQSSDLYDQVSLKYRMSAIQCIFILLGMVIIMLNYYHAMVVNFSSYQMLQTLGATKQQMKIFVMVQNSNPLFFTIPIIIVIESLIYERLMPVIVKGQLWDMIKFKSADITLFVILMMIIFVIIHSVGMIKKLKVYGYS